MDDIVLQNEIGITGATGPTGPTGPTAPVNLGQNVNQMQPH